MFEPIGTGGLSGFVPNAVDRRDVAVESRSDNHKRHVSDDQPIVGIHNGPNCSVGFLGGQCGMKVED